MPEASTSSPVKLPAPVEAIATEQIPVTTKKPFPIIAKSTKKPTTSADPGVSFLPISRVHRIIKADRDIKICSKEAIFLMSKATVRSSHSDYFSRRDYDAVFRSSLADSIANITVNRNSWLVNWPTRPTTMPKLKSDWKQLNIKIYVRLSSPFNYANRVQLIIDALTTNSESGEYARRNRILLFNWFVLSSFHSDEFYLTDLLRAW